jgi:hypothetical protein
VTAVLMFIRMLVSIAAADWSHQPTKVIRVGDKHDTDEVPADVAAAWIENGLAEAYTPPADPTPPAPQLQVLDQVKALSMEEKAEILAHLRAELEPPAAEPDIASSAEDVPPPVDAPAPLASDSAPALAPPSTPPAAEEVKPRGRGRKRQ